MVDYKHPWDHKPKIIERKDFHSRATGSAEWHVYDDRAYFFDVWSNVHYGYVGRAIGFSLSVLLDGAGVAQFKADLAPLKRQLPSCTGTSWMPRCFDRPEDRVSVTLGWELFHHRSVSAHVLVQAITKTRGIGVGDPAKLRAASPSNVGAL